MADKKPTLNRYSQLIEEIFFGSYQSGIKEFVFKRTDLEDAAKKLKIALPKNLGDVIYAIRYRMDLPASILETQPLGMEWIIEGAGRAEYRLKLVKINRILPNPNLIAGRLAGNFKPLIIKGTILTEFRVKKRFFNDYGLPANRPESHCDKNS